MFKLVLFGLKIKNNFDITLRLVDLTQLKIVWKTPAQIAVTLI